MKTNHVDLASIERARFDLRNAHVPAVAEEGARPLNRGGPFQRVSYDLSGTSIVTVGNGYGLLYRRKGSAPGGRLKVSIGGILQSFAPGSRIRGYFDSAVIERDSDSALQGIAELVVLSRSDSDVEDSPADVEQPSSPANLLGSVVNGVVTYITQPENDVNSGGAFSIRGWKRIRVLIDSGATAIESADIYPWWRPIASGSWFEQGTQMVALSMPGSGAGERRRVFTMEVRGDGYLTFEIRNLLPAGLTGLDICVQGIE